MITQPAGYVIQRTSESRHEWWTGGGWSRDERDAIHFELEPHAGEETGDESATVQPISPPEEARRRTGLA